MFYFNLSARGGSGWKSEELSDPGRWAPSFAALQPQENRNKSPPGRESVILMANIKSGQTVLHGGCQPLHPAFPTPLQPVQKSLATSTEHACLIQHPRAWTSPSAPPFSAHPLPRSFLHPCTSQKSARAPGLGMLVLQCRGKELSQLCQNT